MNKFIAFIIIFIFATQYSYASCSSEYRYCRKDARADYKQCRSYCDSSDRNCSEECSLMKEDDYEYCEVEENECSGSRESYPSQNSNQRSLRNQPASHCVTTYGNCRMAVPIPIGSSCYCPTPSGPIWGYGR